MNYAQLTAKIAAWLSNNELTAVIPDFIALAEERINRHLRVRQMEAALTQVPIANNMAAMPADTLDIKTIWLDGRESAPLKPQSLEFVLAMGTDALATHYAWQGNALRLNGGGTISGVIYQKIPALVTTNTNWLSESAGSVYLFGSLIEAEAYSGGDSTLWEARFMAAITELNAQSSNRADQLTSRAR